MLISAVICFFTMKVNFNMVELAMAIIVPTTMMIFWFGIMFPVMMNMYLKKEETITSRSVSNDFKIYLYRAKKLICVNSIVNT